MKRSAGIIVSAVVAIIGSVAQLALGGLTLVTAFMFRANPDIIAQQQSVSQAPFPITVILFAESLVFLGLGIFGIVAAIGLLRLKNWARVSFIVFAVILCFLCVSAVIGTSIMMFVLPQAVAQDANVPSGILTAVFGFYFVFALFVGALAVWWLIYFTRRKVKEQFLSPAELAIPRRGPLSVTIIAWLLVVGGVLSMLYLPFAIPTVLFGMIVRGWAARIFLLVFGMAGLLAGAGMLRWRPRAHALAMGIYVFGLINLISFFVIPGSFGRMDEVFLELAPRALAAPVFPTEMIFRFGMIAGVIGAVVPLWFLITRRSAFLEACKAPPGAISAPTSPLYP
jgi:hypothetical protein